MCRCVDCILAEIITLFPFLVFVHVQLLLEGEVAGHVIDAKVGKTTKRKYLESALIFSSKSLLILISLGSKKRQSKLFFFI